MTVKFFANNVMPQAKNPSRQISRASIRQKASSSKILALMALLGTSLLSSQVAAKNIENKLPKYSSNNTEVITDKVSSQLIEFPNILQNGPQKVNKVLNTNESGDLSDEALLLILNNQMSYRPGFKFKLLSNGKYRMRCGAMPHTVSVPKSKLKSNEVVNIKDAACHYGDYIQVGRSIDGLYWAENVCRLDGRFNFNTYSENGKLLDGESRFDLYRKNNLASLQKVNNIVNNQLFAAVLASMNVFDVEPDVKNNCLYCKINDGSGLKVSYKIEDKSVNGTLEIFSSYDEARYSSQSTKAYAFSYKESDDKLAIIFNQGGEEYIYKAVNGRTYLNGKPCRSDTPFIQKERTPADNEAAYWDSKTRSSARSGPRVGFILGPFILY